MVVPNSTRRASGAAHDAAYEALSEMFNSDEVPVAEVAAALAHAYGTIVGVLAMHGAASDQLEALGRISLRATEATISEMQAQTCAGRA